jgi:hypothetical protein
MNDVLKHDGLDFYPGALCSGIRDYRDDECWEHFKEIVYNEIESFDMD